MRKLALFLISLSTFVGCKKDDDTKTLSLEKTSISLFVQKEEIVKIISGNGQYIATSDNENIASASVENQNVKIVAKNQAGTATITIKDSKNISAALEVNVFDSLSLETDKISINPAKSKKIEILSGSGMYEATSDNENVANVKILENKEILIEAISEGLAIITITDKRTGDKKNISIEVQSDIIISDEGVLTKWSAPIPDNGKLLISSNIKAIAKDVFKSNGDIESIETEGVETIGESAFQSCQGNKSVVLKGVKAIEKSAFAFNAEVLSLTITSVEGSNLIIGTEAFANCPALKQVTLPAQTTQIGARSFAFARALETLTCYAIEPPTIVRTTFQLSSSTKKLIVPKGSKEKYEQSSWKTYFSVIEEM